MNRLHVNQSMAHDLLPDVDDIQLPKVGFAGFIMVKLIGLSCARWGHALLTVGPRSDAWPAPLGDGTHATLPLGAASLLRCSRAGWHHCRSQPCSSKRPHHAAPLLPPHGVQEQQRQGSGGSLLLFKHSIVVVDEQNRAWPVQVCSRLCVPFVSPDWNPDKHAP